MDLQKELGDNYPKYRKQLNLAYIMVTASDAFAMKADDILRRSGGYKFENKYLFKQLRNLLSKILKPVDNLECSEERADAFINASVFLQDLVSELTAKSLSKEDEVKILSHIKNNYT